MRVLLDLNVLLDFLLDREPWSAEAAEVWKAHHAKLLTGVVSAASLPTVFYLVQRAEGREYALTSVRLLFDEFEIAAVDLTTVQSALTMSGVDFEDNLQIACAIQHNADAIVTRYPDDFIASPVPIMSPAELLRTLS